jgi:hypothetical protein
MLEANCAHGDSKSHNPKRAVKSATFELLEELWAFVGEMVQAKFPSPPLQFFCSAAEKSYMIAEVDYPVREAERPPPVFARRRD